MARQYKNRRCETCGTVFMPTGSRERWCSAICSAWGHIEVRGPDECWLCNIRQTKAGYSLIHCRGGHFYAHVMICEEFHGPIPKGYYATHSCDNPPCCNPRHVRPGTPSSNTQESVDRGRRKNVNYATGDRHGMRKSSSRFATEKTCTKCGVLKSIEDFPKVYHRRPGARGAWCKLCKAPRRVIRSG